jgi:beta-glucosidase
MTSYNQLNGDYASESSYLLKDVLRDQWNYNGAVVSDWGAVQDKVKSIKNGMNVEMPGPSSFEDEVKKALASGDLSEETLDESLKPLFDLHEKVKQIDPLESIDLDKHHALARDVAREAIVLLENDGILPVKDTKQKVAIIGQFAKEPRTNGGGSATVKPNNQEIPFDEFSGTFNQLAYAEGYQENDTSEALIGEAVAVAKDSETVFFFTGTTEAIETEGKDRDHLSLPKAHLEVFDAIRQVNDNIIVILSNGSALDLRHIKAHSKAILETWFLGGAAAKATLDIVTGHVNPSGRLQETFPLKIEHTPHYGIFPQLVNADYNKDLIMNGYRYYDTHDQDVLYPFGYGLSYASIVYQNIEWTMNEANEHVASAKITLKNESDIGAYETVQGYVGVRIDHLVKPKKELKTFKKVWVPKQSTETVQLDFSMDAFETYSESDHGFVVYNGAYTLSVGSNSRDIHKERTLTLESQTDYAPQFTLDYPVSFLELFFPKWVNHIEANFRTLWWHEKEEPIWRVLDRYKRHKNVDDDTMNDLIEQIKKDIIDHNGRG